MKLLIGSRGSKLALTQTEMVAAEIRAANPGLETEIKIIKTKGDLIQDKPLNEIGDKGLFVREIEEALLSGKIDLAVHSLKDMPGEQPPGLEMAITPKREDPRDVIISFCGAKKIADLPQGSTIATGSLRRICQLQDLRSDIVTAPIRGNVDTRIRKAHENGYQGIVLAAAGLHRLGISYEGFPLEVTEMLPAPAQGILGLETRIGDKKTLALLAPLHDAASHRQAQAERAFLRYIEGGCHAPMGAFCEISGDSFTLTGFYETERALYKEEISGKSGEEAAAGKALALRLKKKIEAENR